MSENEFLANELARLRKGGIARFHFDPDYRAPMRLSDERIDAWTSVRIMSPPAQAAVNCMSVADTMARSEGPPETREARSARMVVKIMAHAREAFRKVEPVCIEYGTEADRHGGIDEMLLVYVFSRMRRNAMEEMRAAGADMTNPVVEALLGEKQWAAVERGLDGLRMIEDLLRAEAAMNIACDAILGGQIGPVRSRLASVIDEMPKGDGLHATFTRMLTQLDRSGAGGNAS